MLSWLNLHNRHLGTRLSDVGCILCTKLDDVEDWGRSSSMECAAEGLH